ncbi:unnamed protein product [Lymnaea stagnalis]|uniref:DAGKc domain-containing protein n=1 Tax=Lymnaea stagnalis TaxID=6523 RepID=A0AAV2I3G3_LYMST
MENSSPCSAGDHVINKDTLCKENNKIGNLSSESIINSESDAVIIEDIVNVSGKDTQIVLTTNGVKLISPKDRINKKKEGKIGPFLEWRDVISASKDPKSTEQSHQWILNYIHHGSKSIVHHRCLKVHDKNGNSDKLITAIQKQCSKVVGRPKKLFILINPIGGACKGRQIYQKAAEPLFKLASVETHVVVTEKSKHALEIGETHDFSQYDGVVIVGGDGLYQEFLQGLTIQTQKKSGINYDDPNAELSKLNIPIGIIPAGTGNGLTYMINGIQHAETAVLNIIRGEQHRGQIFIVHSGSKFLCVSALAFGYGFFSDYVKRTEELRWMKKARYAYTFIGMLSKKKRFFQAELQYRLKLKANDSSGGNEQGEQQKSDWIIHKNETKNYNCIYSLQGELVDAGDHNIVDPYGSHVMLGAGTGCGHFALFKTMMYTVFGKKINSSSNLDLIDRVTDFKIKVLRDEQGGSERISGARAREIELEHLIDIDGEVIHLESLDMTVRVQPSLTLIYGVKKKQVTHKFQHD